ncbi:hypothetical protein A3770_16p77030 [Chloropicon primus]|uniref:BTB domain-containing protein n=1 Tax=Chloropicon primus TaxID=1764295 RepID=A0A5B8MZT2_9CHLO|nr:hypothetical protein A3770_16p77030 [Chloropicon primus]|eukprot:QDZ25185.1 hypothetical protein A3770_16p77030 [Chloropicon primus]
MEEEGGSGRGVEEEGGEERVRPSSKPGVGRTTEEEEALLYVLWDDDEDELEDEDLDHEDHEAEEILKAKEKTRFHMLFGKKRGSAGGGEASTSNGAGGSGSGDRHAGGACLIHHGSPGANARGGAAKTPAAQAQDPAKSLDNCMEDLLDVLKDRSSLKNSPELIDQLHKVMPSLHALLNDALQGRKRSREYDDEAEDGDAAPGKSGKAVSTDAGTGKSPKVEEKDCAGKRGNAAERDGDSAARGTEGGQEPVRSKAEMKTLLQCNGMSLVPKFMGVLEQELFNQNTAQKKQREEKEKELSIWNQQNRRTRDRQGGAPRTPEWERNQNTVFYFTRKAKKAVHALASMVKIEESIGSIVESGGVRILIEIIRRCVNSKNVSVSRAQKAMNAKHKKSTSMSIHKSAEKILKNTCLIMGFVAMNGQHRRHVIEQGGVGALVNVLRCYSALCVQSQKGQGYMSESIQDQFSLQKGDFRPPHPNTSHTHNAHPQTGSQPAVQARTGAQEDKKAPTNLQSKGRTPMYTIARRAAGALANLAHEDVRTKNLVREEGGIPALVLLLKARESSVQTAAASTLKAIAFRNEDNKNQIVECGALGSLVCMLRSSDPSIHYEAVAVMSSLVHSSAHIKKLVLNCGALQPLINLLSSSDMESRREAALLLGQFANVQDPDYKSKIVQRGALGPLISMLSEGSVQVSEMAAFAIGRLAQNVDNQAGIVQAGGLQPLVQLLSSTYLNSQHNAAFALYGLSDNDDNVPHFLKSGCVSLLLNGKFHVQASKDCVRNTLRKLEEKIAQSHVLVHLKYLLSSEAADLGTRYYIATGLAHLAPQNALHNIFMENRGMDVLFLYALKSDCKNCQKESMDAIHTLGKRSSAFSKLPTLENGVKPGTYQAKQGTFLGENYLDCNKFSDVTFLVEGKRISGHRIAILAASKKAVEILEIDRDEIPVEGVECATWMKVLSFIYSGQVHVTEEDNAPELLEQAERLKLEGLKHACETFLISTIDAQSVGMIFDLAVKCNTCHLQKAAVWYTICEYSRLVQVLGLKTVTEMLSKMFPTFEDSLTFK